MSLSLMPYEFVTARERSRTIMPMELRSEAWPLTRSVPDWKAALCCWKTIETITTITRRMAVEMRISIRENPFFPIRRLLP